MKISYEGDANPNDIVKIQVHIEMKDVAEWTTIREKVAFWASQNSFIVNTIQPIVAYEAGARQKVVKSVKKADEQYLDTFVKRTGADERTAAVGKEIVDLL